MNSWEWAGMVGGIVVGALATLALGLAWAAGTPPAVVGPASGRRPVERG